MKRILPRALALGLTLLLLLPLAACGPEPEVPEEPVERAEIPHTEPDLTETNELLIWACDFKFDPYWKQFQGTDLAEMFQKVYPDIHLTVEYLPASTYEGLNVYLKKDWGEKAPDLIWVSNYPGGTVPVLTFSAGNEAVYHDAYQLIEEGKLLDLDFFIEKDPEFNPALYDDKMLSAGIYRGGRYLMPLGGATNNWALLSSKEAMEKADFSEEAWTNGITLMEELARIQRDGSYKNVIASREMCIELQRIIFDACDPALVDRETGTVLAGREKLRGFCQAWKALFYDSGLDKEATFVLDDSGKSILEDKYLFQLTFSECASSLSGIKTELSPFLRNFPNLEGGVTGEAAGCLGICAEGKNQLNAWRFIKFMLSAEVQEDPDFREGALPSRLSAQASYAQGALANAEAAAEKEFRFGKSAPLSEEEQEMCREAIENVDYYKISSPEVFHIFKTQMGPYFTGGGAYEDCIENLKAALREYLAGK